LREGFFGGRKKKRGGRRLGGTNEPKKKTMGTENQSRLPLGGVDVFPVCQVAELKRREGEIEGNGNEGEEGKRGKER